jgi:hypothetical protein
MFTFSTIAGHAVVCLQIRYFHVYSVLSILSGSSQTPSMQQPETQSQEEETGQREGAIPFTLLSKKGNKQQVIYSMNGLHIQ